LVGIQSPVRLDGFSEPQPDLALLRNREDDYTRSHPSPADVLLLVEVSDSRLKYDLDVKVPLYARFGIPEVWVVDVGGQQIRFFRSLKDGHYADNHRTNSPGVVALTALPAIGVDLKGLLHIG
jgi:Uma2 family endonuclease